MSWVMAAVVLASAFLVVLSRNLVHGVLWLGVTLLATAGVYVGLDAPFVAAVQVLLYAGGVVILLLFGVMLTRKIGGVKVESAPGSPLRGLIVAGSLFGLGVKAILSTPSLAPSTNLTPLRVGDLGRALVGEHLLSFELLSVLLVAAMVGAIVIARRTDAGSERS